MAPESSTLACKIPWVEEPGRLQSMGSLRVRHNWAISLSLFTFMHWRRKWQPTLVFLPGESQGQRSLVVCHLWGRTESDTTEVTLQQQQTITWVRCALFLLIYGQEMTWITVQPQFSSVQSLSCVWLFVTPWTQHARPPCPSPTPRVYSNSCPLSWWCHPAISSSVIPFSSCLQSFPASGSFQMSQFFKSGTKVLEF